MPEEATDVAVEEPAEEQPAVEAAVEVVAVAEPSEGEVKAAEPVIAAAAVEAEADVVQQEETPGEWRGAFWGSAEPSFPVQVIRS